LFYGLNFVFDGKASEDYGLSIANFESGGSKDSQAGSEATLHQKRVYRKPKPYFYGRTFDNPLEFELTIAAENPIAGYDRSVIESWLLGRSGYLPLMIIQEDIGNVIFNVIFTQASAKYAGNFNRGFTLHGICDAPWGYEYPKTLTKTYSGSAIVDETFTFYNASSDNDYLYPEISFTTSGIGTFFDLVNNTDNGRTFEFRSISPYETITVDNYKQIITTDKYIMRIDKFNKKFFRLVQGMNSIRLVSAITNFTMTYSFAKKIGG
jgi:hypothetical protein